MTMAVNAGSIDSVGVSAHRAVARAQSFLWSVLIRMNANEYE